MSETLQFWIWQTTRFIGPAAVALEWLLAALIVLAAATAPRWSARPLGAARRIFGRIAVSPPLAIAFCAFWPVALRVALLPWAPPPVPSIHDEFSHLLLADTLASGRLTNPPHPMWRHFESIHVIQQPSYNSMYPPAHGAALALGQAAFGHPWAGVLMALAAMGAASCWMLRGWMRPKWAFYGALLLTVKLAVFSLWVESYLAAAVPTAGGALLTGALPRLRRSGARALDAAWLGIGLAILMNSRPLEGALLGAMGLVWIAPRARPVRAFAPAAAIVAVAGAATAWYNWRVTGSPTKLPYSVNRDTYGWPENLAILPAKVLAHPDPILRAMYELETGRRKMYAAPLTWIDNYVTRIWENWTVLIGPLLTLPLLVGWRGRLVIPVLAIAALNLAQLVLYPYHLAPVVPVLFALVTQGARRLYIGLRRLRPRAALAFAAALPLALAGSAAIKANAEALRLPLGYWERFTEPHRWARAEVQEWLETRPGQHLVVVRYADGHVPDQEWVYNRAHLDASKVVWAREVDPASDEALLRYFAARQHWMLEVDRFPPRVVRYETNYSPLCPLISRR